MCGFLGAIDFEKGIEAIFPALQKGLRAINHRGPDGSADIRTGRGYLGHNRLSIIDLSSNADQPLKSVRADAYIIFNGEIYNYKELKRDFKNFDFRTASDTEVLLEGYLNFGVKFFRRLRGIYSFAIFDNRRGQKVILGRDPAGIKPLYFYEKDDLFMFGSEIKALLPSVRECLTVNEDLIKSYLNLGYCIEPFTVYREINCIEPGNIVEIENGAVKKHDFIKYEFAGNNNLDFEENAKTVEEKFEKAVARNLTADVEVAVALSGGIDSSLIYAFAQRLKGDIRGITIGSSDDQYDEAAAARVYSKTLGGKHEFLEADAQLNLEVLNEILLNFDQPYADSSAINVYYLTKAASRTTKVLLGGDGGDELFNGYPSQTWLKYIYNYNRGAVSKTGDALLRLGEKLVGKARKRALKRISDLWTDDPRELLYDWHSWFPRKTRCAAADSPFLFDTNDGVRLYNSAFKSEMPDQFKHQIVFDGFRKQMLGDYLRKTDMMSMLNGVEYRVPMLDEDLVAFALTVPFEQKSSIGETKKILRFIHRKMYPPKTSRAPKKGFTIPLDTSLSRAEFACIRENLLKNGNIVHGYIKKSYIEFLFKGLNDGRSVQTEISRAAIYQRILMLYSLSLWNDCK